MTFRPRVARALSHYIAALCRVSLAMDGTAYGVVMSLFSAAGALAGLIAAVLLLMDETLMLLLSRKWAVGRYMVEILLPQVHCLLFRGSEPFSAAAAAPAVEYVLQ